MKLSNKIYSLSDFFRIPFKAGPWPATMILLINLAKGLIPSAKVLAVAGFLDAALAVMRSGQQAWTALPWILTVAGLQAVLWMTVQSMELAKKRLQLDLYASVRGAIIDKRARLAYCHVENAETWDLIKRVAEKSEEKLATGYFSLVGFASLAIQIAGLLIILLAHVWWAALVILSFAIPLFYLAIKAGKANYQAERETAKIKRTADYLSAVLKDRENIEERSLFEYADPLNEQWLAEFEKARKIELKVDARWYTRMKGGSLITTLIALLIVAVLLVPVSSGQITPGLFISLVNAVFGLVQIMSWELSNIMQQLARSREYLKDLTLFAALDETESATTVPQPMAVFHSLEFRDVSFAYPGTDQLIINRLSLTMEAGRHYALVGVNGAGKTTIIKLLAGLYPEYSGEILINGRSLRDYSEAERKGLFAIVFQDFARYAVSMKDNIAIGGNHLASDDQLQEASKQAGLEEVIRRLEQGWDTPVGKFRKGSQDLSGGEWQRLAIARVLVNPAPVRILDEPTAALDPISESHLYEAFEQMNLGRTTLFISHRLGSTKLADKILVIDRGRVAEQGSHAELMDLGGLYADLFATQRSWYQ